MQVWLAEQIGIPVSGYRTLGRCWADWAETCDPVLSPTLFDSSAQEFSAKLQSWLAETADAASMSWLPIPGTRRLLSCPVSSGSVKPDTDEPGTGALIIDTP